MREILKLNRLIIFFIGIGFLVLAFEIYLQHYELLSDKKLTWTPIVFGTIGGTLTLLAAFLFNRFSCYLFFFVMLVSICVGTLGLYLHNVWRFPAIVNFLFHNKPFDFSILTTYTPLLAPSAFIAMGGLGILTVLYEKWGK